MQFLNAIFNVTALAVDMLVNPLWTLRHLRDDKPGIVSGVVVGGAAPVGALAAFRFQRPASTPHSWPWRRHTRVWAGRPETPAQQDARNRHPGAPESVFQEYGDESSSPNAARWQLLPPLLSRCRAVTLRRRDTVRLRR